MDEILIDNNRPCWLEVSPSALEHNLRKVRALCPEQKVMAVIKANGYGHEMLLAAKALHDADEFAVSDMDDARRLREAGISKPITLLSPYWTTALLKIIEGGDIRPAVFDLAHLDLLDQLEASAKVNVWLKVDTGMGRLGIAVDQVQSAAERLTANPAVKNISLMTHFANADSVDHANNQKQIALFDQLKKLHPFVDTSISNSAAVVNFSDLEQSIVRPGMMLYGVSPVANQSAVDLGLKAAMTFKSRLLLVKKMKQGDHIGYAGQYQMANDGQIGVVACGYGDGYPRHAPNSTPVLLNGKKVKLIGRVSMDMVAVDLADHPAQAGDEVILWGNNNPVEEVAKSAGTIAYELCCGVLPRVERKEVA